MPQQHAEESLPRLKPDPLPALHPVPDYLADPVLKARYEDTKSVLQVPWMGVVTMAFAHYPRFYDCLWQGLRPLAASSAFVVACRDLRQQAENGAAALSPAPLAEALGRAGYAPRELAEIRALVEIFSHGNMPYLMIATIARLLLEGEALSTGRTALPFDGRHGPAAGDRLPLMEPHHADPATRAVYADIRNRLGLPFVNTDYRALARWPSYFARAWAALAPAIGTTEYETAVLAVHRRAEGLARALPNPGGLAPGVLQDAAAADASLDEVLQVVRLFQWLLPGLVTNVAVFRRQLD